MSASCSTTTSKSAVWHYFDTTQDKCIQKCKKCNSLLKTKYGNTTNLKNHLRGKHRDIFAELENKTEEEKNENEKKVKTVSQSQQITISECFKTGMKYAASHPKQTEISRDIGKLIVHASPLSTPLCCRCCCCCRRSHHKSGQLARSYAAE